MDPDHHLEEPVNTAQHEPFSNPRLPLLPLPNTQRRKAIDHLLKTQTHPTNPNPTTSRTRTRIRTGPVPTRGRPIPLEQPILLTRIRIRVPRPSIPRPSIRGPIHLAGR